MPLDTSIVGTSFQPVVHDIDARWLMAYAAGIDDTNPLLLDTRAGIVGHPLFPVAPEWAAILAARSRFGEWGLSGDDLRRGVHATHDVRVHRLVEPGMVLTSTLTVTGAESRRPGAFMMCRIRSVDDTGRSIATSDHGFLYLGVGVRGPDRGEDEEPMPSIDVENLAPLVERQVGATAAHIYTETARIWNPIHTDPMVAEAAGLPGIILHGSATLALTISAVVDRHLDRDPRRVGRIRARFEGMVLMPETLTVRTLHDGSRIDAIVQRSDHGSVLSCQIVTA